MQLTDGLMNFLLDNLNKSVVVTFKEDLERSLTGKLMGFDETVMFLNPHDESAPAKQRDTPTFVDLKSVCMIAAAQPMDFEGYKKAFDDFREEYAKKQRRMQSADATETI